MRERKKPQRELGLEKNMDREIVTETLPLRKCAPHTEDGYERALKLFWGHIYTKFRADNPTAEDFIWSPKYDEDLLARSRAQYETLRKRVAAAVSTKRKLKRKYLRLPEQLTCSKNFKKYYGSFFDRLLFDNNIRFSSHYLSDEQRASLQKLIASALKVLLLPIGFFKATEQLLATGRLHNHQKNLSNGLRGNPPPIEQRPLILIPEIQPNAPAAI